LSVTIGNFNNEDPAASVGTVTGTCTPGLDVIVTVRLVKPDITGSIQNAMITQPGAGTTDPSTWTATFNPAVNLTPGLRYLLVAVASKIGDNDATTDLALLGHA
jgi:hypothetical protein